VIGVDTCDVLLLLAHRPSTSGGMWVEFGIAWKAGKRIVVVGERRNIFCELAEASFGDTAEAVEYIAGVNHGEEATEAEAETQA